MFLNILRNYWKFTIFEKKIKTGYLKHKVADFNNTWINHTLAAIAFPRKIRFRPLPVTQRKLFNKKYWQVPCKEHYFPAEVQDIYRSKVVAFFGEDVS
jgi:hypothetical protein